MYPLKKLQQNVQNGKVKSSGDILFKYGRPSWSAICLWFSFPRNECYAQVSCIKILQFHPSLREHLWLPVRGKKLYALYLLFTPISYTIQTLSLQTFLERQLPPISPEVHSVTAVCFSRERIPR